MYIAKLKNTLFYNKIINNFFIVAFAILLLSVSLDYYLVFIILFGYLTYLYIKKKDIFKYTLIILCIYIVFLVIRRLLYYDQSLDSFEGIVKSIEEKDYYKKITITNYFKNVIINDYEFLDISIGDRIFVRGINKKIESIQNEYEFNYYNYLMSKNTISIIKAETIDILDDCFNIFSIRKYIYNYLDNYFSKDSISYIKGFVFGDTKSLDEDIVNNLSINGISHLFAISGLHVTIIIGFIEKGLTKTKLQDKTKENIMIVLLSLYLVLTYFAISVIRAVVMYFLKVFNKRFDLKLSSIDILSIVFIIYVMYNPDIMYNISFQLSFSASFFIILFSSSFKLRKIEEKNKLLSLLLTTLFVQIMTLPFTVNINNSYNILSPFTNIIFINLVTFVILPFSFFLVVFPVFDFIYENVINFFTYLNSIFSEHLSINIDMPEMNHIEIIIFYIVMFMMLSLINNKPKHKIIKIITCVIFMFTYYNKANLNIYGKVTFLNLIEGDSIVIDLPLNNGVVVIDTGTGVNSAVTSYLKASGIRKIDYLVITHSHSDHNGEAKEIINELKVTNIIKSAYDNNRYSNNDIRMTKGDKFKINNYEFIVLNPDNKSSDENDNSIVIYSKLGNLGYIFLGDVTKEIEEKMLKDIINNNLEIDVVKAAHHGSNTSTSSIFYKTINPEYTIIETGRVTKYGFPHKETINTLSLYTKQIFRTDINKEIYIKFNRKKSIIKTIS